MKSPRSTGWTLLLICAFGIGAGAQEPPSPGPQAAAPARPAPAAAPAFDPRAAVGAHASPGIIAEAAVAGNCPPQQPAGDRRNSPAPAAPSYASDAGGKADQAPSPIPFPQVPGRTDWLDSHLAEQYSILQRLYTPAALQTLGQQEASCSDPRTGLYCRMRVRIFWINNAVR